MPTPIGPRSQYALNGVVPGLTWADFVKNFSPSVQSANINGIGQVNAGGFAGYQNAPVDPNADPNERGIAGPDWNVGDGTVSIDGVNTGPYSDYMQDLGDGTRNSFRYDPTTGGVLSHNDTINNDSWWDSTGWPLVASLVAGGATAGFGALGVGVDAAGESVGALGSAAGSSADIGSEAYNAFDPKNWSAALDGSTASDASVAAGSGANAATPGLWDQALGAGKYVSDAYSNLNPLLRTALGTGASSLLKGVTGSGGDSGGDGVDYTAPNPASSTSAPNSFYSPNYDPTSSFINPTNAALTQSEINGYTPNIGQNADGSYSANYGNRSTGGGILSSAYNALTGQGQASDYSSLLGAGTSLLSGVLGSNASRTAANQQTSAINSANALTAQIYGNSVAMNKPFVDAGTGAVNQLANLNGVGPSGAVGQAQAQQNFLATDPGYNFTMDQGLRGAGSTAAARGGLLSGRAYKDATGYAQGLASQQYGQAYNRLAGVATLGQNSANLTANLGQNYAAQSAGLTTAGGIAQSAGTMGSTNAYNNALTQLLKVNANGIYGGYGY